MSAGTISLRRAFPQAQSRRAVNPWVIAVTVTLATFMELLDTAIANVSLPHIAGGLAVSYDESTWVLTSYLVANAVVLPLSAWLSRVFGRKRYYMICVTLFTISSLLCGLAPSLGLLIFFRVLQGIGGGGLAPVEQAILVDTFPAEKRAAAFALYSMAIVTAPVVGPPLGGWITDNWSWRWVFFINIPIGIISLLLTRRLVSDPPEFTREVEAARKGGKLKIDGLGIVLVAMGFACLEVVLDRGQTEDWFGSNFIVAFLAIGVTALVSAAFWEWRHPDPVVEIKLLKERNFAIANVYYFLFGFTLFGSTVLIPQVLQQLYGYTATDAGLVLGPGAMVIVVLAPVMVRILPKIGVKPMIAVGYFIFAMAMWYYASFDLGTDYKHEAWARAIQGLGIAPLFVPVSQLAYSFCRKIKTIRHRA
jgi:MFS transporter, DHA2 family, multidrug resistance protein